MSELTTASEYQSVFGPISILFVLKPLNLVKFHSTSQINHRFAED